MKMLRRALCALLILLMLPALSAAALAEEGYNECRLETIGVILGVPEDVRVLTRDMEDTDLNLRGIGLTASQLTYMMTADGVYLELSRADEDWVFRISAYEPGSYRFFGDWMKDLSEYGNWFREQMLESIRENEPGTAFDLVRVGEKPFYTADEKWDEISARMYFSVVGGLELWLEFIAPAEEFAAYEPILEDLVSHMTFVPVERGEDGAEETPAEQAAEETAGQAAENSAEAPEADTALILYELADDEFSIELPAGLYVLWFGMEEDDLALERLGKTRGMAFTLLRDRGGCLDVISPLLDWEMVASTERNEFTLELGDAALMDRESFEELFGELVLTDDDETVGEDTVGVKIMHKTSIMIGDYRFYRVQIGYDLPDGSSAETMEYITAFGGRFYSFAFSGGVLTKNRQREILSTVRLTAEPVGVRKNIFVSRLDMDAVLRYARWIWIAVAAVGVGVGVSAGTTAVVRRSKAKKAGEVSVSGPDDPPSGDGVQTNEYSVPGGGRNDGIGDRP